MSPTSIDLKFFAVLLEGSEVQVLATLLEGTLSAEAGDSHVGWFVSLLQSLKSASVRLDQSIMEGLGLVELLSVLSSLLVGPHVLFSRPRS